MEMSELLQSRLRMLAAATGGRLLVATGCSGSDLLVLALRRLCDYWQTTYGADIVIDHMFSVENVDWKRNFIMQHVPPRYLFKDMESMCADQVRDEITGSWVSVPVPHLWVCGIECDSVSSCSTLASSNRNCCADGTGATGSTSDACCSFVEKYKPLMICFENVKRLDSNNEQGVSNKAVIVKKLSDLDYEVCDMVLNAKNYGSAQRRNRIYVVAMRKLGRSSDVLKIPMRIRSMRIQHPELSSFLISDTDAGLRRWIAARHMKSAEGEGGDITNKKQKKGSEKDNYMADHLEKYAELHIDWPPTFGEELFVQNVGFLPTRQKEIAWLHRQLVLSQPQEAETMERCIDINMSLAWGNEAIGQAPCLICSSAIFMARRCRLLWGVEAMHLQMWPHAATLAVHSHENLMDLAGNAFCGGCVAAAVTLLLGAKDWTRADFYPVGATSEMAGLTYSACSQPISTTVSDDVAAADTQSVSGASCNDGDGDILSELSELSS